MAIAGERATGGAAPESARPGRERRDEAAVAVFGTWMLIGLFLDGWAHQVNKPETFFSPWHLLLYSGFVAAVAWFAIDGIRRGTGGTPPDRWMTAGLVLFVTGAVGDGIWHEIFGIEVDLEALLSPTHLLLFIGGFLMVTMPVRAALADTDEVRLGWPAWWPQAISLTLSTALVGFFTMYASAFDGVGSHVDPSVLAEEMQAYGVASILLTNLLLLAPTTFVLRRWDPPVGTIVVLFSGVAVLMTGLLGFRNIELVLAPLAGAVAVEVLRRSLPLLATAAISSAILWAAYFLVVEVTEGVQWTVELWAGAIVLAAASSAALVAIARSPERSSVG